MSQIDKERIRTWLVTGASSGIGHELSRQLLERGYNVIGISRRKAVIDTSFQDHALFLSVDVTNPKQINEAVREGIEKFGRIDVLSNNAGVSASVTTEEETIEHIRKLFEVNYFGSLNTIKALLPHFRKNKNGTIINNSSLNGVLGRNYGCAYSSSKAAVEGLTEVLRVETRKFARCMVLEFGWFPGTELWAGKSLYQKPAFEEYSNLPDFYVHRKACKNNLQNAITEIIDEVEKEEIPLRYMLGHDCQERVEAKIESLKKDLKNSSEKVNNYSTLLQLHDKNEFYKNLSSTNKGYSIEALEEVRKRIRRARKNK